MARKCFISFKTEDKEYKKYIQEKLNIDMIDKSLDDAIDSDDEDYVMRKIREDYLADTTVTIHLIGKFSAENRGKEEQKYIKRELQASLYNAEGNTRNGILGVVLPDVSSLVYRGTTVCSKCNGNHTIVAIDDTTTIKEYSYNYYVPHDKCSWSNDDRYCVLVKWDDFVADPNKHIEAAFDKRNQPIADKIKVYP
ncbi:MAG: TIR domain-containing protein [Bacteroidia bacterium]